MDEDTPSTDTQLSRYSYMTYLRMAFARGVSIEEFFETYDFTREWENKE